MTDRPRHASPPCQARIAAAAQAAKRDPASVHLVAVTKTFGPEHIEPVLDAGHRIFGENRVQEAKAKWPALRERYPGIELHLIGSLQSNKAKEAVALFDAIHTVDRPKIAAGDRRRRWPSRAGACSSSSRSTPARSRRRPASLPKETGRLCCGSAATT